MNLNEELVAYVHGELTPDQMVKVEQMMELSPEVREEIAALKLIRTTARTMVQTSESTGKEELLARLRMEPNQMVKPVFPWMKLVPYFGTGLGLLVIGVLGLSQLGVRHSANTRVFPPADQALETSMAPEVSKMPVEFGPESAGSSQSNQTESNAPARVSDQAPGATPKDKVASPRAAKSMAVPNSAATTAPPGYQPEHFGQRDIIRNGDMAVEVEDAKAAMEEASKLVIAMGGFVQSDNFTGSEGSEIVANLLVKIPAEKFESCKTAIGKMGKVIRQNSSSEDVTAQIANSKGRLQSLADSEAMYIRSLRTARTSSERMEIRARLDAIRTERAGLQEEYKRLKSLADLSTLSIQFEQVKTIEPVDGNSNWWSDSWTGASNAFGWVAQNVGRIGIYLLIFAPIWLPIAGYLAWKRKQR